jgi:hypothetical protein
MLMEKVRDKCSKEIVAEIDAVMLRQLQSIISHQIKSQTVIDAMKTNVLSELG